MGSYESWLLILSQHFTFSSRMQVKRIEINLTDKSQAANSVRTYDQNSVQLVEFDGGSVEAWNLLSRTTLAACARILSAPASMRTEPANAK